MRKFLDYNNIQQAIERERKCFADLNSFDTNTTAYCEVIKHPELDIWSVEIADNFEYLFTPEEINSSVEHDETWTVKVEMFAAKSVHCDKCNVDVEIRQFNERFIAICNCGEVLYNENKMIE